MEIQEHFQRAVNTQLKSSTDVTRCKAVKPQAVSVSIFRRFLLAISCMTCLPLLWSVRQIAYDGDRQPVDEDQQAAEQQLSIAENDLSGLAKYLSAVGLFIGIILAACLCCLLWMQVNNLLVALIVTVGWLVLTHGFHLDGLMDTADGIFSHTDKQRMLAIMQDSRVGNFGVMAGLICLLIKWISIYTLITGCLFLHPLADSSAARSWLSNVLIQPLYVIFLLVPAWARWVQSFAMGYFPYLREQGKGKIWHDSMCFPRDLWMGLLCPLSVSLLICLCNYREANNPAMLLPVMLTAICTVGSGAAAAFWLANKFGGHTGDTYGAVVELAEAGSLLCLALLIR